MFLLIIFVWLSSHHQEARVTHILHTLQKTAPPVLIFAEKKQDVDLIQVGVGVFRDCKLTPFYGGDWCV